MIERSNMNFIIHHEAAWKAACSNCKIEGAETPMEWPVIVCVNPSNIDGSKGSILVVTLAMAAKLLLVAPSEKLAKLSDSTRTGLIALAASLIANTPTTLALSIDPITGNEAIIEVVEDSKTLLTTSFIPGIEAIPTDPSKIDIKQKIVDLGDPNEHVLDTERSI